MTSPGLVVCTGIVDGDSRPKFDAFLRDVASGKPPRGYEKVDGVFGEAAPWAKFCPSDASLYEYTFNKVKNQWQLWVDTITREDTKIADSAEFSQIIVPTLDTARYTFLLKVRSRGAGMHA